VKIIEKNKSSFFLEKKKTTRLIFYIYRITSLYNEWSYVTKL